MQWYYFQYREFLHANESVRLVCIRNGVQLVCIKCGKQCKSNHKSFSFTTLTKYIFLKFRSKSNPPTTFTCNLTQPLVQQSRVRTLASSKSFNNHKQVGTLNSNYPNAPFGHKQLVLHYHESGIYLPGIGMYPTNKWNIRICFLGNAYVSF